MNTFTSSMTLVAILLLPSTLNAQVTRAGSNIRTGPVYETDRVTFRLMNTTEELALGAIVRLRVDTPQVGYPYQTLLPPRICTRQGGSPHWNCEAFLPSGTVKLLNVPGKHELYSFTFNLSGESGPSDPWTITTPKGKVK